MRESRAAKSARAFFIKDVGAKREVLKEKQKEVRLMDEELKKDWKNMAPSVRKEKADKLARGDKDLKRLRSDLEEELKKKEKELNRKLLREISEIVKEYSKKEKYSVILEKRSSLTFNPVLSSPVTAGYTLLKEYIIAYNRGALSKSLADGSYRGEEGILRIRPEVARSLGMKVYIDQDYLGAVKLFKEADDSLVKAKEAMTSKKKEQSPGYYSRKIREQFLNYGKNSETAGEQLLAYRSRLNPEVDERLNDMVCGRLLDKL
ncbi:MAG: OmpH family outer membrane protein, partial [Deltaproteobacteria bacterium]|nr:OmpH family outer membrane protein [Deltaproteobacteria bacterium]